MQLRHLVYMGWEEEEENYVAVLLITCDKHLGHMRAAYPKCHLAFGVHGTGRMSLFGYIWCMCMGWGEEEENDVLPLFITPTQDNINECQIDWGDHDCAQNHEFLIRQPSALEPSNRPNG